MSLFSSYYSTKIAEALGIYFNFNDIKVMAVASAIHALHIELKINAKRQ